MSNGQRTHGLARLVLGMLLIATGAVLLLDNLGVVDAHAILDYWPLLIVAFGVTRMTDPEHRCFGTLVTLAGVWLLLGSLDLVDWRLEQVWPIALVVVGGCMILRALSGAPPHRLRRREGQPLPDGGPQ